MCSSFSEGYSTACAEAAILGIPIITTAVAGAEEIINDAECGLVTGLDDESLKAGLRKILTHQDLITQWREIMKTTCQHFKLPARKKAANDLFDELSKLSDERMRSS